jgi:hypothetical protein
MVKKVTPITVTLRRFFSSGFEHRFHGGFFCCFYLGGKAQVARAPLTPRSLLSLQCLSQSLINYNY